MDYLFVHINKCGGTSIKDALGNQRNEYQRYKHERIADIAKRMLDKEFEDTFKFSFIRNPYDRIASMYRYRKYNLSRVKLIGVSFEEWFWKAFTEKGYTAVPLMNKPCWDYISIDGALAVDFVGKVEDMHADWQKVCGILGINAQLPKLNQSRVNHQCKYTEEMKQLVEVKFKKDLEFYEDFS